MRELLYFSEGKLRGFVDGPARRLSNVLDRGIEVEVSPVGGRAHVGPANAKSGDPFEKLERVIRHLEDSPGTRLIEDPSIRQGDWAELQCELKFGRFHKDGGPVEQNVVLFRGFTSLSDTAQDVLRDVDQTEVLLGGWIGHILDQEDLGDWSHRMGSATADIYRLWSEIAHADRDGDDQVPSEFSRLDETASSDIPLETLDEVVRSVFAHGTWSDPLDARDGNRMERAYVRGFARVLAVLPADEYHNRLVLGTPLYLEYAHRPATSGVAQPAPAPSVERLSLWRWRRRRP